MKTNLCILTLAAVCLCGQVFSQFDILDESTTDDPLNHKHIEEPIDISAFDGSLFEILDQVFDSVRRDPVITGMTAALMTPDGEIWTRAGGWAALFPESDLLRTDHLMGSGPTTSLVSATILSMYEDGLLDLNDLISDYVGPYPNVSIWTRIRHLLCHRSGINDYINENPQDVPVGYMYPDSVWVIDSILNNFVLAPNFPVGQTYSYSNTNFLLAGRVIESITGMPWYEVVRNRVIEPMGLSQTFAYPFEMPDGFELSHAFIQLDTSFIGLDTGLLDIQGSGISDIGTFSFGASGGCIVSTPYDIARFKTQLHGGYFLNDTTLERAHMDYYPESTGAYVGYGMFRRQFADHNAWGHTGSIYYLSTGYYFPELEISLVVQQNDSRLGGEYSDDMFDMFDALLGAYLQYTATTSVINPEQPDDFRVFPNPGGDMLYIEWKPSGSGYNAGKCLISTLQGQPVMRIDIVPGINRLETSALLSGIYLINLNGAVKKVIVH